MCEKLWRGKISPKLRTSWYRSRSVEEVMINSLTTKANFPQSFRLDDTLMLPFIFAPGKGRLHTLSVLCSLPLPHFLSSSQQCTIRASHRQEMGNGLPLCSSKATYNPTGDYRRLQGPESPRCISNQAHAINSPLPLPPSPFPSLMFSRLTSTAPVQSWSKFPSPTRITDAQLDHPLFQ